LTKGQQQEEWIMEAMMNFSEDELLIMQDFTNWCIELIKAKCMTEKVNVLVLVV
jgi:hypothetical protein